jgi:hypothetical protein
MRLCPHCGTQNPPEAVGCERCGKALGPLDQTVGFAPPIAKQRFRGTMIGIAPPSAPLSTQPGPDIAPIPATPPTPEPHGRRLRQTMIGIAPLNPPTVGSASPSVGPADASKDLPTTSGYPTPPPPPNPSVAATPSRSATGPRGTQHLESGKKTMLGVARPGIAPLNPTHSKAPSAAPVPSPVSRNEARVSGPARPASLSERTSRDEPSPRKPGIPALAAVAMVGAAGLFAAAAVVWLFYHGHGAIEAHAVAAADGSEQLELNCPACEDGTLLRLDAANAAFRSHHATLPLTRPLKVGKNPMTITLVSATGKQSFVDISVPIAFRIRGDTSGLEAPAPELRVVVDSLPGSSAMVDGKPLALSAKGEGTYTIDVSAEVSGLDATVKPLERSVPYVITPPNGASQTGIVNLQGGITPLVIDAPGAAVVIETSNFVLAGRTAKAGALTVDDRPISVDPTGRFAQLMNVSAPGETTIVIRATSKDAAPRLFPLRVKRVDSLAHEAERVRRRATSNYAAIADQSDAKPGWAVALDGTVVDARSENYNTVAVMDVEGGCSHAPCLARIVYGAPFSLSPGDKFSVFGEVVGLVDGPRTGTRIPEIRADFLIKAGK